MKNKQALFKLSYGLFILTARDGDRDNGCITNTCMQVAEGPVRIACAINKSNLTHDMVLETGVFNVSILSEEAQFDTFKHWGFQTGHEVDKMVEVEYSRADNGVVYFTDQVDAYLCAKVVQSIDLGSHTLFIAEVTDGDVVSDVAPATYAYYFAHIKPKPAKPKVKGWICKICGYIYEGDPLPEDFICPLCKHPASDFEPLEG